MSLIDHNLMNAMSKYVETLTTSGKPELDETLMTNFKRICKKSDEYVKHAFHLLMTQLNQGHSEIRLSAFLMCDELFTRSHHFRELLLADFQTFLGLTAEINYNEPLPPPKKAANMLKNRTYKTVQKWYDKYAEEYRKLALAYNYLKNCKKINFTEIRARAEAERQREEAEQQRRELVRQQKLSRCLHEMTELQPEIDNCLSQLDSCMKLLLPTLDDFDINAEDDLMQVASETSEKETKTEILSDKSLQDNSELKNGKMPKRTCEDVRSVKPDDIPEGIAGQLQGIEGSSSKFVTNSQSPGNSIEDSNEVDKNSERVNDEDEDEDSEEDSEDDMDYAPDSELMRQHGLGSMKYNITIDIEPGVIKENEDNTDILNAVRDSSKLISSKYLPFVSDWLKILKNNGGQQEHMSQIGILEQRLEAALQKYKEMKIPDVLRRSATLVVADDAEDDFETVPEKDGYEEDIPEHLKEESSFGCEPPSNSTHNTSYSKPGGSLSSELAKRATAINQNQGQKVATEKPEPQHRHDSSVAESGTPGEDSRKQRLLKKAPLVPYDMDLHHWGNPDVKPAPVVRVESAHRFWTPREVNEEYFNSESLEALKTRTIEFSGTFEPVKWKCRAPMPSGKLCERMDRLKCPFHGKIIARDEKGKPTHPEDLERMMKEEEKKKEEATPDWQDPALLRELKASTGIDLTITAGKRGKGKGKGKKKKYPNLTDIKAVGNTSRKRLEKKVLNKSAVRRVTNALDSLDYKRAKDRFANQFNYALK